MILSRRTAFILAAATVASGGCAMPHEPDHTHSVFFAPDSDALDVAARDVLLPPKGLIKRLFVAFVYCLVFK